MEKLTTRTLRVPFILATTLFFLWGFARNILTVLNKHTQDLFSISIGQSSWLEVTTFLGYFIMALPAGLAVSHWGYKAGILTGLSLFALGCLLFIPCTMAGTFEALLIAIFVIACGLVFLEVSANPYVTQLGPASTSAARLNLAQSLNGFGGILAPLIAGWLLLGDDSEGRLALPYTLMGIFVAVIAIVFSRVKLPAAITTTTETAAFAKDTATPDLSDRLARPFWFALLALLAYEVAEICLNSYFINFMVGYIGMSAVSASSLLSAGLLVFMLGRLLGSWVMQRMAPARLLTYCAVGSTLSMAGILWMGLAGCHDTDLTVALFMMNFLCESIMFPTIYSLALDHLTPRRVSQGGSLLMMTPVGGCTFLLMGTMADRLNFIVPFLLPLAGFAIVLCYSLWINSRQGHK